MRQIAVIPRITRLHAEDAAFLFTQRRAQIDGALFGAEDLGRLDQRLSANLDGLCAAGQSGWDITLETAQEVPGRGEVFALAALALMLRDDRRVAEALELGLAAGGVGWCGLSGAVARIPPSTLGARVRGWLGSAEPGLRWLGVAALSHHRVDPGAGLSALISDTDPLVRKRAARLAGELGRRDLLTEVEAQLQDDAEGLPEDAPGCSVCLLGEAARAAPEIEARVRSAPGDTAVARALDLLLLALPADQARALLTRLLQRPDTESLGLSRTGLTGDRSILSWLVTRMEMPEQAAAAGAALLDLYPLHPDESGLFTTDPDRLGEAFAGRDPGLYPIAAAVKDWAAADCPIPTPFRSLRHERLEALRAAIANPGRPLANWRATRPFPAWL